MTIIVPLVKKAGAILLSLVVLGVAIWKVSSIRGAPEPHDPKFEGKRLSRLLKEDWQAGQNRGIPAETLRSKEELALNWLIWAVEHGRHPQEPNSFPSALLPNQLQWVRSTLISKGIWSGYDEQFAAARALGTMQEAAAPAIPTLKRLLGQDERLVSNAAVALTNMGESAWGTVVQALEEGSPTARRWLLVTLWARAFPGRKPASEAQLTQLLEEVAKRLRDPDRDVRLIAVGCIEGLSMVVTSSTAFEPAMPALIPLLDDPEQDIRAMALRSLATLGPRASPAVPQLMEILRNGDEVARPRAAVALGQVDLVEKRSRHVLLEISRDASPGVSKAAVDALSAMGIAASDD
jgi:hypothetical protein